MHLPSTLRNLQTLQINIDNHIASVSLNRPSKRNAMSFKMVNELITTAKILKKDKTLRAIILQGNGESFCAGIDLSDLNNPKNFAYATWELVKPGLSDYQKVCLIWREMPVPVLAVLHGHCFGAGMQLALGADIRISKPDCQLAIMEGRWGLVPDMGLTQSLLSVVPPDVAKELAMSARVVSGMQAKELGLVTHVTDNPLAKAEQLAQEFASRSPDGVLASKRIINNMYAQSTSALRSEKIWQLKMMLSTNRKIAMKAKQGVAKFVKRQYS